MGFGFHSDEVDSSEVGRLVSLGVGTKRGFELLLLNWESGVWAEECGK